MTTIAKRFNTLFGDCHETDDTGMISKWLKENNPKVSKQREGKNTVFRFTDGSVANLQMAIADKDREITGDDESTKVQRMIDDGSIVKEIERWAKDKNRAEKVNLAADLVDPLVGRARFGLEAIYKILDAKAVRDGQNFTFDLATGDITQVKPK
jgi:hypothetical protein